jgi:multidrug efflux pump
MAIAAARGCRQQSAAAGLSDLYQRRPRYAGRLGITLATVDNALYDSFGQRIVSTIFTESNQYRVIIGWSDTPMQALQSIYLPSSAGGGQVPLPTIATVTQQKRAAADQSSRPVSGGDDLLQPGAGRFAWAVRSTRSTRPKQDLGMPISVMTSFQGAALAFQRSLGNELLLILAAIITVYIVLGVLYESYIHPITILSTLAFGRRRRACWR